ncbi:MAG: GspE/PulE family protein [Fimbriimonadales bacterium]|nr:GspE/PulE family protein [Fimbriimonadales bacterium]MDW8051119.1 GspE/PulE family protein [Armatimonadota bacterium]
MYGVKRLGEWLLQKGKITQAQLEEALATQRLTGKKLGETLIELGYITPDDYYEAQAEQWECPFEPLHEATIEQARRVRHWISPQDASRFLVVPLREEAGTLWVATADPNNVEVLDHLRRTTGRHIKVAFSPPERILQALTQLYGMAELGTSNADAELETELTEPEETDDLTLLEQTVHQAPVIRLVNSILLEAVEKGASDIHFEPMENRLQVRLRIDGVLYPVRTIPRSLQAAVLARVKLLGEMDIADRRRPQDGRFSFKAGERRIDARVSSLPTVFGERVVVRLLDRENALKSLNQLGMPPQVEQGLVELASRPWGMILVTGPTGSGKSTTLYALLQHIKSDRRNILTCEDPVEFTIEGIGQSQVNERAGLTFASQLRAILRQDPDVVLVGEIRDTETAEIACRAAMTGHLVLATLHTNDSTSAPARLMDMGVPPFLINSALIGVLAQRLVRRLCPYCKQPTTITDPLITRWFGGAPVEAYQATGCTACNNIGYKGRVGLYELFIISEPVRRLIAKEADSETLRAAAPPNTLFTIQQDAIQKVREGITTIEEVLSQVQFGHGHAQAA